MSLQLIIYVRQILAKYSHNQKIDVFKNNKNKFTLKIVLLPTFIKRYKTRL